MASAVLVKAMDKEKVHDAAEEYLRFHNDNETNNLEARNTKYTKMVNLYYDLATDLYEWGWGQSFHFAVQRKNESFAASIARHEHFLAHTLELKQNDRVLDIGCGVGGPARSIAHFSGAQVTGLNNNQYQIERATKLTKSQGLEKRVSFVKGDFMHLPFDNDTFDAVYEIEATAHAPSKVDCYKEVLRVLKPGQIFAGYEWCLTDKYDPSNEEHRRIKKCIEEGDGLPDIATTKEVEAALVEAGFELLGCRDVAEDYREGFDYTWYHQLTPGVYPPSRVQFTGFGRTVGRTSLSILETMRLVPKGTTTVSNFLNTGAEGLVAGGRLGIFTPMFLHVARKPMKAVSKAA
eukprot:Colp12_sorted_trinity150504_noHs@28481